MSDNTISWLRVWNAFKLMGCTWNEWCDFQEDYFKKHNDWCLLE